MNWKQIFMTKSTPSEADRFPFLVLGNKMDMENDRAVSEFEGKKFC